jgi:ketosteroid isomerase-like protein
MQMRSKGASTQISCLVLGVLAASLFGCRPILAAPSGADPAAAEAAVRKADADWAAAASTAGVDAWMTFYAADAIVLLPNDRLVSGREQVRDAVTHLLTLPRLSVAWHPDKVEIVRTGDVAYLIGTYELRFGDSRGIPLSDRGRLLELWKRQTDGSWKCVVETWISDEPAHTAASASSQGAPRGAPPGASPAAPIAHAEPPAPPAAPSPESHGASAATDSVTPAQELTAKYGEMPVQYEEAIRQYFQEQLKDPYSVQYREITKPQKGYTTGVTGTVLMRETRDYGWTVKATINAKNSRGKYVGFKSYTFLFRGEKIVHALGPLGEDELKRSQ